MTRTALGAGLVATWLWALGLQAQAAPVMRVQSSDGSMESVPVAMSSGYAALPASVLEELGWQLSQADGLTSFTAPSGAVVILSTSTPFFTLDGVLLQLADVPYDEGEGLMVPLQLLSDFLPRRFPDRYAFDGPTLTLRAGPPPGGAQSSPGNAEPLVALEVPEEIAPAEESAPVPVSLVEPDEIAPDFQVPSAYDGVRVVVIDAGHGGVDPGTTGAGGVKEKTVVLAIALSLAEALLDEPGLEVHLLRDDDTFIPVWDRGQLATDIRGERAGVFISIHANAMPTRGPVRGFETYFLSEARTDHERRVAAIENAPISMGGDGVAPTGDLDFILRELRNLDHQHWSALLAATIQEEVALFHPGPDRGVKQAPLAVITNALMPSVIVEIGYLSHRQEERLLATESFQHDAAQAIARAVMRFFERYPPESGGGGGGVRP